MLGLQEKVSQFLELSPHNPLFIREFDDLVDKVTMAKSYGTIEHEESLNLLNALKAKKAGLPLPDIDDAFKNYKTTLLKSNNDTFIFHVTGVHQVLEGRRICGMFFEAMKESLNEKKHSHGNPHANNFVLELAKKCLELYNSKDESLWDYVETLYTFLTNGIKYGVLYRPSVAKFSDLVMSIKLQEYDSYKSNKPEEQTRKMSLFEEEVNKNVIDFEQVLLELQYSFLKSMDLFKQTYNKYYNLFVEYLRIGKFNDKDYTHYVSRLAGVHRYLLDTELAVDYQPILTYQYLIENNLDIRNMMYYSEQQIFKACQFANVFLKTFTNENIEMLILTDRVVSNYIHSAKAEVDSSINKGLMLRSLKLLKDYDIISTTKYFSYLDKIGGDIND